MLLVDAAMPHDLLLAVCQQFQMSGLMVAGILTPVESEQFRGRDFREGLGIPVIPLLIHQAATTHLVSLLEMTTEPYRTYQQYF
jgi:hypothetical protein